MTNGTRKRCRVSVTPRPLFIPGKDPVLGGPQGWSGQVRKISPAPGLNPRTVQPVASRYTDRATRPTEVCSGLWICGKFVHHCGDGRHLFELILAVIGLEQFSKALIEFMRNVL
jgi:hypothetical protein